MFRKLMVSFVVCLAACSSDVGDDLTDDQAELQSPFPSSIDVLPSNWQTLSKYKFELAQKYPSRKPAAKTTKTAPWLAIDFKTDPDAYVMALRDYSLNGFVHTDDPDADFRGEYNTAAKWFNVPWMHTGLRGREGLHGLTRERDTMPGRLAPTQTHKFQDWGIGFYNDMGGYAVGRVWRNHDKPNPSAARFENGSVVFKILLTDADVAEVPWLKTAPAWKANINIDTASKTKAIKTVRLAQMDIAAKDDRAPAGWVYTTLVFDPTAKGQDPKWGAYGKMMPVGTSWGNDPGVMPGGLLHETAIADQIPAAAKATLGYGGRLNGPGDNPISACYSCHQTAEWKPVSAMTPPVGAAPDVIAKWFRDLKSLEPFDQGSQSLDSSLQLQISLVNFTNANPQSPIGSAMDAPKGITDPQQ